MAEDSSPAPVTPTPNVQYLERGPPEGVDPVGIRARVQELPHLLVVPAGGGAAQPVAEAVAPGRPLHRPRGPDPHARPCLSDSPARELSRRADAAPPPRGQRPPPRPPAPGQAAPIPWARPCVARCARLGRDRALQCPLLPDSKRGGERRAGGCGKISALSLGTPGGRRRTARCRQSAPQAENRGQLGTPAGECDFTIPESVERLLRTLLPCGGAVRAGEIRGWDCGPAPPTPPHTGEVGC